MGCSCGTATESLTSDSFLACASAPVIEADSAEIETFAHRVGTPSTGWYLCYAVAALRCHRLIYAKKTYSGLTGDCGTQTTLGANIPGLIGTEQVLPGQRQAYCPVR